MEKIVIFDAGNPLTSKNKLFDRDFVYTISHTLLPICYLSEKAHQNNITFITPDVFLENAKKFDGKKIFLISQLTSNNTVELIELGAIPLLLLCQESPFIATRFYLNLNKISSLFKYTSVFSGMRKKVSKKTQYCQMFFPQIDTTSTGVKKSFIEKKYLTMISSAKSIGSLKKTLLLKFFYGLEVKEIYSERIKALSYFSKNTEFDLYGYSWDAVDANRVIKKAINKVYRGTVENKKEALNDYKFALCFENSIFEGYITEKIFDCFFAGTIPIYYGAPDIDKYVPENTFIDFRKFSNYEELDTYLKSFDKDTYALYQKNIANFLKSEQFHLFTEAKFADFVINLIQE